MSKVMSVRIPDDLEKSLLEFSEKESKPTSEVIRELLEKGLKEKRIELALQLYKEGKVTLWKAATIANVSLWEMVEKLKERKIEVQYGQRELEEDLKALED